MEGLGRNSKDKARGAILHIIELYSQRKIPNITTVENMILALRSPNKRLANKALKDYAKLTEKYEDAEALPDKHLRLKKEKQETKVAHNKASMKITKMFRTAVTIHITKKESAMKDKVVDYTLQFGYIGTVIKYDMTALISRAYVLGKKALESKQKFKFYSTIKLWSRNNHAFKPDVFSGDDPSTEPSKWLDKFIEQIKAVIQSDDQIVLRQSILKFHIVFFTWRGRWLRYWFYAEGKYL